MYKIKREELFQLKKSLLLLRIKRVMESQPKSGVKSIKKNVAKLFTERK